MNDKKRVIRFIEFDKYLRRDKLLNKWELTNFCEDDNEVYQYWFTSKEVGMSLYYAFGVEKSEVDI